MLSALASDLRFAARNLGKQPGLAAVAVLTLALGIGANTALFSVIDSVLLTPPPFREPGRLVVAWGSNPELARAVGLPDKIPLSNADFFDWQSGTSSAFSHLAMLKADRVNLTGQGEPEQLGTVRVSGDFFTVLGTPAALGRTLQPADERVGKPAAVVLSHALWQRKFGADPRVIGRTVSLSGLPVEVVGVMPIAFAFPRGAEMPAGFGFTAEPDLWLPLALTAEQRQNRGGHGNIAIGRLKPGVTVASADAALKTVAARLAQAHPDTNKGWSAKVLPMSEQLVGDIRPALLVLWAAVGAVLLIACANVASLLLARAAVREREIALRTAIGAGRGRLISQLLTESGLLALLGGAFGVAFAALGLKAFAAFLPAGVAGAGMSLSFRVLAWTALLCLLTCVLSGLAPALQLTRPDLSSSLREGSRGSAGAGRSRRTQRSLVVAEVALAVVLLVGAGLLLRSFSQLLRVDPGFKTAHALSLEIDLPGDRYTEPQRAAFFDRLLARLSALPGVSAAGAVSALPMGGEDINSLTLEGRPAPTPDHPYLADSRQATAGYFAAMGIPLRRGRLFAATDTREAAKVAVVDEVLARAFWPGEDPLGKRFRNGGPKSKDPWITVIGVVGSVRNSGLHVDPRPQMYQPESQASSPGMAVVLRTTGDPKSLAAAARAAVHEVDRDQPVANVETLDQLVAASVAGRRFNLLLLGLFAGLALTLSGVGIYGVTAYSVVQRTREMGLRMALGSQAGQVLRLVVGEAGALAGMGVLLGLLASFALTRVMSSLLYGVGTTDPATFTMVALGLLLIALLAAGLPGMRATRVDPMVALRGE